VLFREGFNSLFPRAPTCATVRRVFYADVVMFFRLSKLFLICSLGILSTPLSVCHGEAPVPASDVSVYERRLIEQTSDEIRTTYQMIGNSADSARMFEAMIRMAIPATSLDVSKLKVEYTDAKGAVVPTTPGMLKNLFVLRGKFRNNHERFRAMMAVFRVSLKDCVGGKCEPIGTTACRAQYVVPITSEVSVDVPLLFPTPLNLKGTLKAEVEVAASWGQLEPSVQERDMAEVEEMEAEDEKKADAEKSKI